MTRTEHDIRDALNAKAAEAADQVSLPVSRPRSPRRLAPVLGAIAAVAAVAVTVSLVATRDKSSTATPTPTPTPTPTTVPSPPRTGCGAAATKNITLRYDFRVDGPAGFTYTPESLCVAMQQMLVSGKDSITHQSENPKVTSPVGSVSVFPAGAFNPKAVEKGRAVTVQGHRGYFATLPIIGAWGPAVGSAVLPPGAVVLEPPKPAPALAWEYALDSWAVVQASWSTNPLADTQLIAAHVRIGEHQPIPMPFKLGWVPNGLVVGGAQDLMIGLSDSTPAKSADCTTASCGSAMSVGVYTPGVPDAPHGPGTRRLKIGDHPAIIYPKASELDVGFGDRTLWIRVDPNHIGKFSDQDLIKIAQNVTMSPNMTNRKTWFDATTVVSH
jgi:hypothetical protein